MSSVSFFMPACSRKRARRRRPQQPTSIFVCALVLRFATCYYAILHKVPDEAMDGIDDPYSERVPLCEPTKSVPERPSKVSQT